MRRDMSSYALFTRQGGFGKPKTKLYRKRGWRKKAPEYGGKLWQRLKIETRKEPGICL